MRQWFPYSLAWLCFLCLSVPLSAQSDWPAPKQSLSLSALHLLDPIFPSITLAYQRPLARHPQHYLVYEAGPMLNWGIMPEHRLQQLDGLRLRLAWRKIKSSRTLVRSDHFRYREISLGYHWLDARMMGVFDRYEGVFQQLLPYNLRRQAFTAAVFWGDSGFFKEVWQLDVSMGVGMRVHYHRHPNTSIPGDAFFSLENQGFYVWDYAPNESEFSVLPYIGIRFAFGRRW